MDDQVKELLLNGMPVSVFTVWYVVALAGALVYLLSRIYKAINSDPKTPNKFSWRHTSRGLVKFAAAMILLPWTIIYFSDVAPIFLEFMFQTDGHVPIELNGFSAFATGLSVDVLVHKAFKIKEVLPKKNGG